MDAIDSLTVQTTKNLSSSGSARVSLRKLCKICLVLKTYRKSTGAWCGSSTAVFDEATDRVSCRPLSPSSTRRCHGRCIIFLPTGMKNEGGFPNSLSPDRISMVQRLSLVTCSWRTRTTRLCHTLTVSLIAYPLGASLAYATSDDDRPDLCVVHKQISTAVSFHRGCALTFTDLCINRQLTTGASLSGSSGFRGSIW